ncbi:MAG: discoidin domain-containing protein, partial [Gemmatimonadales bacterium]
LVLGERDFIERVLPHMEAQYAGWIDERYDPEHEMFKWVGAWDGMETNINSRQTDDHFSGAEGYRPTLNSYMYADALAISRAAMLLGDSVKSRTYALRAARIKERVQEELWDSEREFFYHQFANDEPGGIRAGSLTYETGPYAGSPHGRELIGYIPWQFHLPDAGYEGAWQFLMDPEYFAAPYGPTTVERGDPLFFISPRCCVWSGNAWPYATTQTLAAMANLLHDYEQTVVSRDDYVHLLMTYARSHRKDGRPYIAEAANPDDGSWAGHDSFYHSEHYFHSGFIDLIVTGLIGVRPRADDTLEVDPLVPDNWEYFALDDVFYHGHSISVVWDRDGSHFGKGTGLALFVDGAEAARRADVGRLATRLSRARDSGTIDRPHNFAVNNGSGFFPHISASFSAPQSPPFYANDGNYWYHQSPPNRWTFEGSDSASEWLMVDFGVARPVEEVKLYFLDEEGVKPPESYRVQTWSDGEWADPANQRRRPERPTGRRANSVSFEKQDVSRVRVVFFPREGTAAGVTEFEVWGHADLPLPAPTSSISNLAYNASGTGFPRASASFTSPHDEVKQLNDGIVAFTRYSRNRWTAFASPNERDWVEIDFGEERLVGSLDLYVWADERGVGSPLSYLVRYWTGDRWVDADVLERVPQEATAWARNRVTVTPFEAQKIRVNFEHDTPQFTGITEMAVWGADPAK